MKHATMGVEVVIDFDSLARHVAEDGDESWLIEALARANDRIAMTSGHRAEAEFARESADKLRELAKWLKEGAP